MISLSDQQKSIWLNTDFFLHKKEITSKIYASGSTIIESIKTTSFCVNTALQFQNPKISKGENYNNLPWVMVDFPCIFSIENIFAFRMFFLWGTEINFFFLLKGIFLNQCLPYILQNIYKEDFKDVLICKNENLWQHHVDEKYRSIQSFNIEQLKLKIEQQGFLKLAIHKNANSIETVEQQALEAWLIYCKLSGV
ncbi:MAG: hypothetical protein RI955_1619 [Bacteroidota bacterium]|jgi:hypothetical protein